MFHLGIGTTQAAKDCDSDQVKLLLELKANKSLKDWAFFAPRNWKFPKNLKLQKFDTQTCIDLDGT